MVHIGPFLFIALRGLLAAMALAPLAWREWSQQEKHPCQASLLRWSFLAGLAFSCAAALQQVGLVTATATNAGFLTALYVVITPFVAWILMRQKPGLQVGLAAVMSFFGTWLLGGGSLEVLTRGDVFVALSAFLWALHVVLVGFAARHGRVATFTALQFVIVALLAFIMTGFYEQVCWQSIWKARYDVLFVGVLSSALTFTLLALAMRSTQPAKVAVLLSTESLFSALSAYLILGERLPPIAWLGALAIFAATLVVHVPSRKA